MGYRKPRQHQGFTLIEMLIALAILVAVLLVAVPGYQTMIKNNRMVTEVYALRATLNNARSEAITRRTQVVICPSLNGTSCSDTNNWGQGYMTFVDRDMNGTPDSTNLDEELIQFEARDVRVNILSDVLDDEIRFNPRGTALGYEGTFTFCDDRGTTEARGLILTPVGSVSAARDTDDPVDGIINDAGGSNVSC